MSLSNRTSWTSYLSHLVAPSRSSESVSWSLTCATNSFPDQVSWLHCFTREISSHHFLHLMSMRIFRLWYRHLYYRPSILLRTITTVSMAKGTQIAVKGSARTNRVCCMAILLILIWIYSRDAVNISYTSGNLRTFIHNLNYYVPKPQNRTSAHHIRSHGCISKKHVQRLHFTYRVAR